MSTSPPRLKLAFLLSILTTGLLALHGVFADPGHSFDEEVAKQAAWLKTRPRSLASCSKQLERRGDIGEAQVRRRHLLRQARAELGVLENTIAGRSLADYDFSHNVNLNLNGAFGLQMPDAMALFADQSNCVLQPEVNALGHYLAKSIVRSDIHERQIGIPLILEVQLVNTKTCQPIPNTFIDVYQCNSTGVYSGVVQRGNGKDGDLSNIDATFGRGMQRTDANGVATFRTIFPGHYYGVANHIHVLIHNDARPTITRPDGARFVQATHNGRIFFDQQLIHQVEASTPYNTNHQSLTLNANDVVLNMEAEVMDPIVRYTLIGNRIEDGILG